MGVDITRVDETDSGWECHTPRFRVYLLGSGTASPSGWTDTDDVTGADVLQAIDWAQREAGDRFTYAIALVDEDEARDHREPGSGRGLVWLVGMDGNDTAIANNLGSFIPALLSGSLTAARTITQVSWTAAVYRIAVFAIVTAAAWTIARRAQLRTHRATSQLTNQQP